ncbi:MAG: cell fate (sporulation/competence/biofilm development) regulator YlbF (YheA/YmcA/DUF963 family) [Kiritimatiellia bacterium]|jgi:cell fate (sporulation/competence/biofilm development) regulator YlbF (YheA/YmcA/DUF963 family)
MITLDQAKETPVIEKARELCDVLASQSSFKALQASVQAFMDSSEVQAMYHGLGSKQAALQEKQQSGMPLSDEEIADFDKDRDDLLANPIAKGFLDAQKSMKELQKTFNSYLSLTFELGRCPTSDEVDEEQNASGGCCGGGGGGGGGGGCGGGGCG